MNMRFVQLKLHWEVEEADRMIEQLDHFRDALWAAYGDQITDMRRQWDNEQQYPLEFDDPIDF